MEISRRKFIAQSSGLLFSAQPFLKTFAANLYSSKKILVLIYLAGGNDWLNTIIPYQNPQYYTARPSLAIASDSVLHLHQNLACHPACSPLKILYDQNKMAILLNVGSDQATLSHHKAIEIIQQQKPISWVGRYAELARQTSNLVFPAINVEPFLTSNDQITISSLSRENKFSFDVDVHYRLNPASNEFAIANAIALEKQNPFSHGLEQIADLIRQNYNATVYNISLGGFDTHCSQLEQHALVLRMLSSGIFSFQNYLETLGLTDHVLTVVYSEFGRSVQENHNKGTDHGLINHILVIGNKVKGGIYGQYDFESDLFQFDFRQVYATLLERWLDQQSTPILGENFENLYFI